MRRFLYFIPDDPATGATGVNKHRLSSVGALGRFLAHGGDLIGFSSAWTDAGPAGHGMLVGTGDRPPLYVPTHQRWVQGPQMWAGVEDKDAPPTPEDLVRDVGISGYEIELVGGQRWTIPLIRKWNAERLAHEPNVPTFLSSTVDGGKRTFARKIAPEFEAADSLAGRAFQAFAERSIIPIEQLYDDAVAMLAVNYRIGSEEAELLGILDETTALNVLAVSVDYPKLQAQAAKWAVEGLQGQDSPQEDEG